MEFLINLYANVSGLWKKIASFLPLIVGLGTLLSGLAGFCNEFGHAANAAAIFKLMQNLQSDPNTALVIAGLAALGIHTNHAENKAALQDHADALDAIAPTKPTPPAS